MDLTGNVKNREMEVFKKQYGCRFRLFPCDRPSPQAGAGDPETQAANRDAGGAESEIVKGSVSARGTELSDFEDRCIADQQDAVYGKARMVGNAIPITIVVPNRR